MKIHKTKENKLSKLVLFSGNRSVWLEETMNRWMQIRAAEMKQSITYHRGDN